MTPNIIEEQRKPIEQASAEYANKEIGNFKYLGSIAAREQWHQTYKDFEAGYAAAWQQKHDEIARLRKALKQIAKTDRPGHPFNTIATMAQIAAEALKPIIP